MLLPAYFGTKLDLESNSSDESILLNFFKKTKLVNFCRKLNSYFSFLTGNRYPDIPRLKGFPFLGRLPHLFKEEGVLRNFMKAGELAANHPSGMCYYWMGNQLILLITNPQNVHELHVRNEVNVSRNVPFKIFEKFFGNNSAADVGENWREAWTEQREIYTKHLLKKPALASLYSSMEEIVNQNFSDFDLNNNNSLIDLRRFFLQMEMRITCRTLLGSELSNEQVLEFIDFATELGYQLFSFKQLLKWSLPSIVRRLMFYKEKEDFNTLHTRLTNRFVEILYKRNQEGIQNSDNCLRALTRLYCPKSKDAVLEGHDFFSEACMIIIASTESTTSAFLFTIKLLGAHPEIENKLREALKKELQSKEITMENVDNIPYLEMVIKESLRLYPSLPIYPKAVEKPFKLGNVNLFKDNLIIYAPYITHRLAKFWKEPDKFIPERFSGENDSIPRYGYIPFGMGAHVCLGQRFAHQVLKFFLAKIYMNYLVEIPDNTFEVSLSNGSLKPKKPLMVRFKKIQENFVS